MEAKKPRLDIPEDEQIEPTSVDQFSILALPHHCQGRIIAKLDYTTFCVLRRCTIVRATVYDYQHLCHFWDIQNIKTTETTSMTLYVRNRPNSKVVIEMSNKKVLLWMDKRFCPVWRISQDIGKLANAASKYSISVKTIMICAKETVTDKTIWNLNQLTAMAGTERLFVFRYIPSGPGFVHNIRNVSYVRIHSPTADVDICRLPEQIQEYHTGFEHINMERLNNYLRIWVSRFRDQPKTLCLNYISELSMGIVAKEVFNGISPWLITTLKIGTKYRISRPTGEETLELRLCEVTLRKLTITQPQILIL